MKRQLSRCWRGRAHHGPMIPSSPTEFGTLSTAAGKKHHPKESRSRMRSLSWRQNCGRPAPRHTPYIPLRSLDTAGISHPAQMIPPTMGKILLIHTRVPSIRMGSNRRLDFGIRVSEFFLDLFRGLKLLVLTSRACGPVSCNTARMYARAVLIG